MDISTIVMLSLKITGNVLPAVALRVLAGIVFEFRKCVF